MIFYSDGEIVIRTMTEADAEALAAGELAQGWGDTADTAAVKRGYVPDGSGVWFHDEVCPPYGDCRNDDELVLYLSKKLR